MSNELSLDNYFFLLGYCLNIFAYMFKIYHSVNNLSFEEYVKLTNYIEQNKLKFKPIPVSMTPLGVLIPYLSYISSFQYYKDLQNFLNSSREFKYVDYLMQRRCFTTNKN